MNSKFQSLVDQILEFYWQSSPVQATFLGIHRFDGKLDRTDSLFRKEYLKKSKIYLQELNKFDSSSLSLEEELDWKILSSSMETDIRTEEEIRSYERNPGIYPEIALFGIYLLILREFAPLEKRMEAVLERLKEIPRLMSEAKENLKKKEDIPKVWAEIALESTLAGTSFFSQFIPYVAEKTTTLKTELVSASNSAALSFSDFAEFLEKEVLPKARGNYACGKELFDFLLTKFHLLPYKNDQLLEIGEKVLKETKEEIKKLSSQIDPQRTWMELVAEAKKDHPEEDELLDFYKNEMGKSRQFVIDKNLVSIPQDEVLEVVETPAFERNTMPYGGYVPPAPFDRIQQGFFWVTPVEKFFTPEEKKDRLEGHNRFKAVITSLHEAYPGHHLQLVYSNRCDSKVRRQFSTSVFAEGWALYCEEMMFEQGFYTDPRVRLFQLKDQIWRACRVIMDVKLHTHKMSFDEAVDFLMDQAKLEKTNAIAEVKRYTKNPTQPLSYLIGKTEILKLKDEYKKKKGGSFNLKEFHEKLLSYGTIPIQLVKDNMLR